MSRYAACIDSVLGQTEMCGMYAACVNAKMYLPAGFVHGSMMCVNCHYCCGVLWHLLAWSLACVCVVCIRVCACMTRTSYIHFFISEHVFVCVFNICVMQLLWKMAGFMID